MTWRSLWKAIKKWFRLLLDPREFRKGYERGYLKTRTSMKRAASVEDSKEEEAKRWKKNHKSP